MEGNDIPVEFEARRSSDEISIINENGFLSRMELWLEPTVQDVMQRLCVKG
jgi:hypothetical protein